MGNKRSNRSHLVGRVMQAVFLLCGILVLLMVAVVSIAIFAEGVTAFWRSGIRSFLFGSVWEPNAANPSYGLWPLILTTLYMVGAAVAVAAPLGILCALFMVRVAPPGLRTFMLQLSTLMGNLPSVVYGLIGIVWVLPGIQRLFGRPYGEGLLATIVVMAAIFVPRIANMAVLNLEAVPREIEQAALALGATPLETCWYVTLRYVRGDLLVTVLMQTGIVAGETLAVMMVAGNVANMPRLFSSVQTLATAIGAEAFSTGSEQWHMLFSIALVTFLLSGLLFGAVRFVNHIKRGGKP